jgi:leader peptidase (prepilin peptidase)/N-methyltransferase
MALLVLSLFIGLVVGSFLGRCIYWLPQQGSTLKWGLAYCPCQRSFAWYYQIPILSWVWLRGRCPACGERISAHYPLAEGITGVFFALAYWRFGFPVAIPIWLLGSVLVLATFIDIEHFLIPDLVSKPAIVAGVLASLLVPQLHGTTSRLLAFGLSILGALVGGGLLFLIGELGKLVFGRYKVTLPAPVPFHFEKLPPDDAQIVIDNDAFRCGDHFFRKSDRIRIRAEEVMVNDQKFQAAELSLYYHYVETPAGIIPLTNLYLLEGRTAYAEFPREAMGLGDVKLIAAIGAFTGWSGVLFTIAAASVISALYGVATILIRRRDWSAKIPFGPYLAMGAVLWIFGGKVFLGLASLSLVSYP